MRRIFWPLALLLITLFVSCENDNIEQKYYQIIAEQSDSSNLTDGKIAWFPFNGNLSDTTENNTQIMVVGTPKYVNGLNADFGKGLHLDGKSYLIIKLGYYDSLSVVIWVKGDGELNGLNKPVLFDYGQNALSAQLDASTGATTLNSQKGDKKATSLKSSTKYLNSYNKYSLLYFESSGTTTKVLFKGYLQNGAAITYNQDLSLPGIIAPQSEFLYIGHSSMRDDKNKTNFKGAIDEIQIFNRPLTDTEIDALAFTHTK